MRNRYALWTVLRAILVINVAASSLVLGSCANLDLTSRTYNFQSSGSSPQNATSIAGKAGPNDGVLIIRFVDGVDTRTDPLLARVYDASSKFQPPIAPKQVSVDAGEHTIGVLYVLVDALFDDPEKASLWWGKYLTSKYALTMKQEYANDLVFEPENRDHVVSVKHFEKLKFSCSAGSTCVVYPVFDEGNAHAALAVKECDTHLANCRAVASTVLETKIAVVSNYSYTDI